MGDRLGELVLVAQRVQRMGVGCQYPLETRRPERLSVLLPQHVEEALLAGATHVVAGIPLGFEEQSEIDPGAVEQLRHGSRYFSRPGVECGLIAHEPQVLRRFVAQILDLEIEAFGPASPLFGRLAEAVAAPSQRLEGVLQSGLDVAGVDQATPQLDDGGHVFYAYRTRLHTGHARRTRP